MHFTIGFKGAGSVIAALMMALWVYEILSSSYSFGDETMTLTLKGKQGGSASEAPDVVGVSKYVVELAQADPAVDDLGSEFLPFREQLVLEEFRAAPRLYYDWTLVRLSDDFGIMDDALTDEELEEIVQGVVDLYAQGNVYIRVRRSDLILKQNLSRKRSLAALAYVEGPDLGDMAESRRSGGLDPENEEHGLSQYFAWFTKENRQAYGPKMGVVENALNIAHLRSPDGHHEKDKFLRDMIDWIFGFPVSFRPWDLAFSHVIFPVYHYHGMNGVSGGGRIVARTGSCFTRKKQLIDKTTKQSVKMETCRRFIPDLKERNSRNESRIWRDYEMTPVSKDVGIRLFAHELGHCLGLNHPSSKCVETKTWKEGNLMQQLRFIGLQGQGCPIHPGKEQSQALFLTSRQWSRIRKRVEKIDVRPSPTLFQCKTFGESTMQLGSTSPSPFHKILSNRGSLSGPGSRKTFSKCGKPQKLVILPNIGNGVLDGNIKRVRFTPVRGNRTRSSMVVQPLIVKPRPESPNFYEIVDRGDVVKIPKYSQERHVEFDVQPQLRIAPGQFFALASRSPKGNGLNIDHRIYRSEDVTYADIVGPMRGLFGKLMPDHLEFETTYPDIALATETSQTTFLASNTMINDDVSIVETSEEDNTVPCNNLLINIDVC